MVPFPCQDGTFVQTKNRLFKFGALIDPHGPITKTGCSVITFMPQIPAVDTAYRTVDRYVLIKQNTYKSIQCV